LILPTATAVGQHGSPLPGLIKEKLLERLQQEMFSDAEYFFNKKTPASKVQEVLIIELITQVFVCIRAFDGIVNKIDIYPVNLTF